MVDDDDENDDENHSNQENLNLSKVVKQNSHKIGLLESSQQEIIYQLRLLIEKLRKQTLQNDDGVHSSNQNKTNPEKPITH